MRLHKVWIRWPRNRLRISSTLAMDSLRLTEVACGEEYLRQQARLESGLYRNEHSPN